MTLDTFSPKLLMKSHGKIKMVLKYVIKRISHGLWLDMIFIQLVMCFLSPRQGLGIENTLLVG